MWWFLIQLLLETDAKRSTDGPPPAFVVASMPNVLLATLLLLWWFHIQVVVATDVTCASGGPPLVVVSMPNALMAAHPPLVVVSYSIFIRN